MTSDDITPVPCPQCGNPPAIYLAAVQGHMQEWLAECAMCGRHWGESPVYTGGPSWRDAVRSWNDDAQEWREEREEAAS